jgi:hypothetical protein
VLDAGGFDARPVGFYARFDLAELVSIVCFATGGTDGAESRDLNVRSSSRDG